MKILEGDIKVMSDSDYYSDGTVYIEGNSCGEVAMKEGEEIKQQILDNQKIADKAIHLLISDTKGLALFYINQLFWYYTTDKSKRESDKNWLLEYRNDIDDFRKLLFKIDNERITYQKKEKK